MMIFIGIDLVNDSECVGMLLCVARVSTSYPPPTCLSSGCFPITTAHGTKFIIQINLAKGTKSSLDKLFEI